MALSPSEVRPACQNEEACIPRDSRDTDGYHLSAPDHVANEAVDYGFIEQSGWSRYGG